MSFLKPKDVIDEGDTVILYISVNSMHVIEATPTIVNKKGETIEHIFQTSFGALKVRNIIGVKYGSRVELSKGYAYVLLPNPELWTQTLPHRTQIIYTPDISMILHQLEVKPGSIVVESGTGSGSLSHYFLRAVKPHGHLHTFDFHEARANQAREEFQHHGLGDFVTVYHRDVCENGFGEDLNTKADAVFLDLPAPQLAVPHAYKALKESGMFFSIFNTTKFLVIGGLTKRLQRDYGTMFSSICIHFEYSLQRNNRQQKKIKRRKSEKNCLCNEHQFPFDFMVTATI